MEDIQVAALAHSRLDFNAPLSDARAAALVAELQVGPEPRVLDLGCGWGELLLRLLAANPAGTGLGVDTNPVAVARATAAAVDRGLADRVTFEIGDATAAGRGPVDVVLCVGSSQAWGGTGNALGALRGLVGPGGRVLLGDAFWERSPTETELAALGAQPGDYGTLADLVDLALRHGFRPLGIGAANPDDWDAFESRWCGGLERWLLDHPASPDAVRIRTIADDHRNGWLRGYRGVLGFGYLTLGVPR